jgi:hypothetical protein
MKDARVLEHNTKVYETKEKFLDELPGMTINFKQWIDYNTLIAPLIREGADLVHKLHEEGLTEYKINMQSGLIK